MKTPIYYRHDTPVRVYLNPTSYLIGGGSRNSVKLRFMPLEFAATYDSEYGELNLEYMVCGGWGSNKKAMNELRNLLKIGLQIADITITATAPVKRITNCRPRFARYISSGVSVKTAKPVAA